jgi:hypothetical protein
MASAVPTALAARAGRFAKATWKVNTARSIARFAIRLGPFTLFFNGAARAHSGCVSEHAASTACHGATAMPAEVI